MDFTGTSILLVYNCTKNDPYNKDLVTNEEKFTMTFLDDDDSLIVNDTIGFTLAFAILSIANFITVSQGIWETSRTHFLYDRYSLKVLFPWASFVQCLENATLAYDVSGKQIGKPWAYIIYALEATVDASLLLSSFDVTYSIHKTRCILFCGVVDGHTKSKNPTISMLLKVAMRLIALGLMIIGIFVNFDLIQPNNTLAGRIGWYYLVTRKWSNQSWHVLWSLIPGAVASLASFYFSIALWRYGTTYSMVVHASPFNPWFSPFFGTVALFGSQWFDERWFPLLSNLGTFVYVESMLLLFMEVNKDMEATTDLVDFLDVVQGKPAGVKHNEEDSTDSTTNREEKLNDEEDVTPIEN
jgi:hypothetical protein